MKRHEAIEKMLLRVDATLAQRGEDFPHYADSTTGDWTRSPAGDWTGGFWCGMLWLAAAGTGDAAYRRHALDWAERLRPRLASKSVFKGFLFWYGAELGHVLCDDASARVLAVAGARSLAEMYNPTARLIPLGTEAEEASDVGTSEANIDALPGTLALLLGSVRELGDEVAEIALWHGRRHVELCVRDDGSICQSATFDPTTGALRRRYTHKGVHDDSTWGRAQAWGMLAFAQAMAAGATEFEPVALRVADWWLANAPADGAAFWDFDDSAIPDAPRDTSATAIAASALLKLSRLCPQKREVYAGAAEKTIDALTSRHLTPVGSGDRRPRGILADGCFNQRTGLAVANELIFGDYFLLETLLALEGRIVPERV